MIDFFQIIGLDNFEVGLTTWQVIAIFSIFVWGGIVRTALSFGGVALSLPLLLMIYPDPLFFLPVIGLQLLFFGIQNVYKGWAHIDWKYLGKLLLLLLPSKIIGIIGLLKLPIEILLYIIYGFSLFYGCNYLFFRRQFLQSKFLEICILLLGGYMSGTALSGAPIIVGIVARHVTRLALRPTLFSLWTILVTMKLVSMQAVGVSLQFRHQLWLFPAALLGTYIGAKVYQHIQKMPNSVYYRFLGFFMLIIGLIGVIQIIVEQ